MVIAAILLSIAALGLLAIDLITWFSLKKIEARVNDQGEAIEVALATLASLVRILEIMEIMVIKAITDKTDKTEEKKKCSKTS